MKRLIAILAATSILYTTNPLSAEQLIDGSPTKMPPMPTNIESRVDKNNSQTNDSSDIYKKGNKSLELSLAFGKDVLGKEKDEAENLMIGGISLRRGRMLCDPSESWMLPKGYVNNYEFLFGPNIALSSQGYFAGIDGVLTTHIMPKDRSWVISPLFGFGVQANDMYKHTDQRAIGQQFVFETTVGINAVFPKLSEKVSYGLSFSHKSYGTTNWSDDADVPNRNHGLNVVSAVIRYRF